LAEYDGDVVEVEGQNEAEISKNKLSAQAEESLEVELDG